MKKFEFKSSAFKPARKGKNGGDNRTRSRWNGGGEEARWGRRLKQSRSLPAFICYYFIVSSAKDGPRVSPVLNRVRSVNRSVLSANRTRETTLGLISTSNRIRLLLFYYAVKAILNHLWDAPVPRKGFCLVFSLLVTPFGF